MKTNFSTKYVYLHDENTKVNDKNKNRCNPVYIMGGGGDTAIFCKKLAGHKYFTKIVGNETEAILYNWVSNTFDTHVK